MSTTADRHSRVPALAGDVNGNGPGATTPRPAAPSAGVRVRGGVLYGRFPWQVIDGNACPLPNREEDDSD